MRIQLNTAATTMQELQKKIDITANNLSNLNTTGYKRHTANFSDALTQSIERQAGLPYEVGRMTPNGLRIGLGAKIAQTSIDTKQSSVRTTDRPLDFMIDGDTGYFRVASEGRTYYTRAGAFQLQPVPNTNQVQLVTSAGDAVLDYQDNPITFASDYNQIEGNENGTIRVSYEDPAREAIAFQLSIAEILRPNLLEKVGANRYQLPGTEAAQVANGTLQIVNLSEQNDRSIKIHQGALEMSNVDLTEEMIELMLTQRLIQSQGRALSFADDMMGLVNTMRG